VTGENPTTFIARHMNLDPGDLEAEDQLANLRAVREGTRVFSAYELRDGTRIWIITEADCSVTTILLSEELSLLKSRPARSVCILRTDPLSRRSWSDGWQSSLGH
jgi:hypothetical protein